MTADQRAAYVVLVKAAEPLYQLLRKSDEINPTGLIDAHDPRVSKVLRDILISARRRFLLAFKPADAQSIKDDVTAALERAFPATLAARLVDALLPIATDLIDHAAANYSVELDTDKANEAALSYLRERVDNVFRDLSDAQAQAVYNAIADAKSESHTLDDIVASVRSVVGRQLSWETDDGPRSMDVDTWATMTARTEGTRAAAAGTKAALQSGGYETWRWLAEGAACADCAGNDDEVVQIGDTFPSGASEPPGHPNCRCVVLPNVAELTGEDDDSED